MFDFGWASIGVSQFYSTCYGWVFFFFLSHKALTPMLVVSPGTRSTIKPSAVTEKPPQILFIQELAWSCAVSFMC